MKPTRVAVAGLAAILAILPAAAEEAKTATMYKPLQCGCCDEYAAYLEQHGFKVKIESLPDRRLDAIKRQASVPRDFEGCHTLMVDGYVVEGLVPIGPLNKLLTEAGRQGHLAAGHAGRRTRHARPQSRSADHL